MLPFRAYLIAQFRAKSAKSPMFLVASVKKKGCERAGGGGSEDIREIPADCTRTCTRNLGFPSLEQARPKQRSWANGTPF